jgi:N6-adenosine-specific RNA methylase IME4
MASKQPKANLEATEAYGALREGVHIAGYTFERACTKLEWLIADNSRWRGVGGGFDSVNKFMDSVRLENLKAPAEQRKRIANRLIELQPKVSNRAIAGTLGVDESTVRADTAGNPARRKGKASKNGKGKLATAGNPALGGADAAKLVGRKERAAAQRELNALTAKLPATVPRGKFGTIVIDPPWEIEKIERDVRPNQVALDYPTMDEDELRIFGNHILAPKVADDCHLFTWTTPKFLPMALRLVEAWGFRYVLTMVWHKPGGFQPIGLPQYNAEFVVYARRGTPKFKDTKAFNICNEWPRREHSRKPDGFYELLARVTAKPRIDMFSREAREGFAQYGNEPEKFQGAA